MDDSKKLNTRATGVIALAVMCSRVLGLVREILFSALFGSASLGIFLVAFRVPNLLRDLFAEGALSTAFITVFTKQIEREGDASAWRLARKMLTLALVFMSGVSALGIVFAGPLLDVVAAGFKPEYRAMTTLLTQIMFPFILLVSLAALVMGMLNAKNVFGVPAMASSFFNIGSIAGGALIGWWIDPRFGRDALVGLAVGTLAGGLLQLAIQLPSLRKAGFSFRPDFAWRDPGVRQILTLMAPSVIAASAVQVNVMVNTNFATFLGPSAVTWLNNSFRLMQLPIGVFGVAVATITLPVVSRIAATADRSQFGPTLGKAMRLAIFLTLPSATGLYLLAEPIIRIIYEHRQFKAFDTSQTAFALQFYATGLVAYSCIKVLSPAFYAIDRKWTPMLVSFGAIALNIALNWFLIFRAGFGHRGLAFSTAVSATANFLVLYVAMTRAAGTLGTRANLAALAKCAGACAVLGIVCRAGQSAASAWLPRPVFLVDLAILLALIALSAAAYLAACLLLRVEAAADAASALGRRLSRLPRR